MTESDAHLVMSWLTDAIDSIEDPSIDTIAKQDAPLNQTEDAVYPQNPNENMVVDANRALELDDTDKSKTNIPPEFSQREADETAAMPFLRRKAKRSKAESETIEKAIDGLKAWAAIEKATHSIESPEDPCDISMILKSFNIDEKSFDVSQVLKGTLLAKVLNSDNRPSGDWWEACSEFMKSLEGLEEPGSFATSLYYYADSFDPDEFITKADDDAIATAGENVQILDYQTRNFDICPGAVFAFESIVECGCDNPTDTQALIKKAAKETDRFLGMEKKFLDKGKLDTNELEEMVRSIAATHYMVGQLSQQLDKDFTDAFGFTSAHITNVSFMLDGINTELQKTARLGTTQHGSLPVMNIAPDDRMMDKQGEEETGEWLEMGENNVDELIYTENEDAPDDELELCQKCAGELEKCGHKQDRKDLETPAATGPMDRGEQRPNVIMRSEESGAT